MVRTRRSGCREHGDGTTGRRRINTISLLLLEDDNPESERRVGVGSMVCSPSTFSWMG